MLALALAGFLAGLVGVAIRLRREFPPSIVTITVALLAGATPLAYLAFIEPNLVEVGAFALVAWLGAVAASPMAARAHAMRVGVWVAITAVVLVEWPMRWWPSHFGDVLFSSWHGFLSWTPVAYAAVIGTIAYVRKDRVSAIAALALLVAAAWLAGARDEWLTEAGFSTRRMTPLFAILAPGLAYLLDVMRRRPVLAIVPLVIAPLVWNHLLMVQYTVGLLPKDEPISFARLVRQQPEAYARSSGFYPFAFPANVWFAWRERVPVDRYDLLAVEPRRDSFDLTLDRRARRYLLEGWDAPGMEGSSPVWWLRDRIATLAVPLAVPGDGAIEVIVRARSRFEEPVVQSDLSLLVNGRAIGDFSPGATAATDARFVVPAGQGFWRDGINQIAFATRGAHRVDPNDPRPPGPLARRRGNPPWPVAIYRISIRPTP